MWKNRPVVFRLSGPGLQKTLLESTTVVFSGRFWEFIPINNFSLGYSVLLLYLHFLMSSFKYQLLDVGISVECRSAAARVTIDQCAAHTKALLENT